MPISGGGTAAFNIYTYSGVLANGAAFTPANRTVVLTACLYTGNAAAANQWQVRDIIDPIADSFEMNHDVYYRGIPHLVMCDGTDVNYRNTTGTGRTLSLRGWSI